MPRTRAAFNSKNSEDALFSSPVALLCGQEIPVLSIWILQGKGLTSHRDSWIERELSAWIHQSTCFFYIPEMSTPPNSKGEIAGRPTEPGRAAALSVTPRSVVRVG